MKNILLVGFPNSGKSTIFNLLSGQQRKVSNYSGITVSATSSLLKSSRDYDDDVSVIDLPGIYNLIPTSVDESETISYIFGRCEYHLIAFVLDMERFEASLSLAFALRDIVGDKLVIIVNKNDHNQFNRDNCKKLECLVGLRVLSFSSRSSKKNGVREVDRFLRDNLYNDSITLVNKLLFPRSRLHDIDCNVYENFLDIVDTESKIAEQLKSYHLKSRDIKEHFSFQSENFNLTAKLDSFLMHPIWGMVSFIAIFYLIFHSIYYWSSPLMDIIDVATASLGHYVGDLLPQGYLNSLLTDGVIAGVGGVIIFLPQIMILFFLFTILEQSGYISRAAVLTDKLMNCFGLNGKSFLPYMSGFACSIPAIMAARTIPNEKERVATIMTIPLITCSARLPVYIILIGTFVPDRTIFGFLNLQPLSFFFLYFLGSFFALLMALIFRLTYFKGSTSNFYIDLPLYQWPSLKMATKVAGRNGLYFVRKAGTIILLLSIFIWFASTFPSPHNDVLIGKSSEEVSYLTLENSMLGSAGKIIEPVIKPLGMDWKMGVSLLVAFGARELFVSTMGTIYALGDVDEESKSLKERLRSEINPITGKPAFNLAVAWSLLIFFVFSMQCISTLAILRRETGGWKIPVVVFSYMMTLAYVGSFVVYQVMSL
jgi:ferrous iron transport protein B